MLLSGKSVWLFNSFVVLWRLCKSHSSIEHCMCLILLIMLLRVTCLRARSRRLLILPADHVPGARIFSQALPGCILSGIRGHHLTILTGSFRSRNGSNQRCGVRMRMIVSHCMSHIDSCLIKWSCHSHYLVWTIVFVDLFSRLCWLLGLISL